MAVTLPFGMLSDAECWQQLPPVESSGDGLLPNWAKVVTKFAPRTAAALLRLDFVQRTGSPLPAALRAKLRWVIARANRCAYTQAYAELDGKLAGVLPEAFALLAQGEEAWPAEERSALKFVWQMTVDAPQTTDEQFAELVLQYGEKQTAAMVLLAAYGNFQDRLATVLGLPMEEGGPLPAKEVRFVRDPGALVFPPHGKVAGDDALPSLKNNGPDNAWSDLPYDALQERLERQRNRQARLTVPTWDEVKAKLPPEYPVDKPLAIVWMLICLGYVPELAIPWSAMTRTFWGESQQDRILEESLFWIQTRTIRCNYCMGHCEMLLEVAGMDSPAIDRRLRQLASGDWSAFPAAEQVAYAFARKITAEPWAIDESDLQGLVKAYGETQAFFIAVWLCRGLYMTRVSDGFQLPLERENVFAALFGD